MNILFLTIIRIDDISDRGIYPDLMRKFSNEGHNVYIITPVERRSGNKSSIKTSKNVTILKIKTLNIQKSNLMEKWFGMQLLGYQYLWGIRKYFRDVKFELVIYSTPPITFLSLISLLKSRYGTVTYLLLKDIFPQNAVDLGLIKKEGLLHRYFLRKEKKLYRLSDHIGCMSQANMNFIRRANPEIDPDRVEINPNSHELFEDYLTTDQRNRIRKKYGIPADSVCLIFGGNLGKPQGVDFILDFIDSQKDKKAAYFLIVGNGTEFKKIKAWFDGKRPANAALIRELPKDEYNLLLKSCDIGMIFLDRRFEVPNFPSRLLYYMEYKMPVLAATDINTDIREIMIENNFGFWSEAGDLDSIDQNVNKLLENSDLRKTMGQNGFTFLMENYTVNHSYNIIARHF